MDYRIAKQEAVIRLDDGDEIVSSLKSVCKREGIGSALVSGIGAARKVEIAHYDTRERRYNSIKLEGMLEIVSLSGNISMLGGEPSPHLHMAISKSDFSTFSGHLMSAEIYPTCEIVLFQLGAKVERKPDKKTGLNLQSF